MEKSRFILKISCCMIMTIILLFFSMNLHAVVDLEELSLHEMTKIYSKNNSDFFVGCENFEEYMHSEPTMTVFTHGYDSNASHWSNDATKGNILADNASSLIHKIAVKNNYCVDIYLAQCLSQENFVLTKYSWDLKEKKDVSRITDSTNHIIVLFQSGKPTQTNEYVYEEFENVVDTLSLQYKSITGVLPRINLVGHSRGGITNIMYAAEHPYNVSMIYSMGTPYNSSILGQFDGILGTLDFYEKDETGNITLKPGIKSILNREEAKKIRDKWNSAYKSDVQAHVIALGSATSVNYIEALINDVVNSNNNFKDIVNDYIDLLISIVDSIEEYPKLSSNVLSFFKGMAKVLSAFSINIYEQLIQHFNDDWSGSLTVEEGNAILSLYEVINDEAVIMDDLFIDVNSQLGYFDDNINYAGFNRYVKIFEPSDLTDNRAVNNLPAVVHNMETMNDTYTDFISNDIICGSSYECASIFELENVAGEFVGEKSFVFETKYSGLRKIIVNCNYSIYEKLGKEVEIDCNDNVYLEENKSYYIVLRSNSYINYQLKLDVNSIFNGSYELAPNSQNIFKLQANSIGFYDLNSSLLNIKFLDLDNNEIFYVYYNGNNLYVVVKNDCNYKVNVMLSLSTPNKILSENLSYNCQKNTIVMVESKDICMLYELSISKSSSVKILNSQNQKINYNIINSDKKKYIFSISKNETFYIVFGDNTTTILTGINDNLAWYINDKEIYENIINVYQNYSYNIVMKLKVDNEVVDIDCNYLLVDANNYFEIIEDNVYVNENAKLSSSASYCHIDFPTRAISIVVVPTNRMTTIVYNDEKIRIKFYKKLGKNDNLSMLNFTIKYGNNQQIINCNMNINKLDYYYYFSDDLMKKMTTKCTFVFGYVIINGHMYDASFFDVKEIDFNGLYSCGSGTSIDPYIISSERNLKNINENKNSYFKLNANISLSDGWKPFYFRGEINGDGHRINYLIFDSIDNGNVGLFSENFGTVKNLEINMASINISKCDKISITFGFIAGVNFGTIQNIIIKNSKIDAQKIGASVGFISGKNNGNIYDCTSESNILLASDEAGGIVGNNSGNINNCFVNSINITYTTEYSDNVYSNGNVGGVCGSNYGSIINCNSSGNFVWNENDNSLYIYPGLGKIIGFNSGSYFQCSSQIVVNIHYYWFIWYNQSGRCFKIDNGNVGYES